jgi:hypothetical protein
MIVVTDDTLLTFVYTICVQYMFYKIKLRVH